MNPGSAPLPPSCPGSMVTTSPTRGGTLTAPRYGGAAEGVDPAVGRHDPVARAAGVERDGGTPQQADRRARERCPEREHPAVAGHQAVAAAPAACMPTTGESRVRAAGRSLEAGVPEGEDAAVGGDQPVPATVRRSPPCPPRDGSAPCRPWIRGSRRPRRRRCRRRRRPASSRHRPAWPPCPRWGGSAPSRPSNRGTRRRRRRRSPRPRRPSSSPPSEAVGVMPTTGRTNGRAPAEPSNGAPKAKTPPSDAASQYPPVARSPAEATTRWVLVTTSSRGAPSATRTTRRAGADRCTTAGVRPPPAAPWSSAPFRPPR